VPLPSRSFQYARTWSPVICYLLIHELLELSKDAYTNGKVSKDSDGFFCVCANKTSQQGRFCFVFFSLEEFPGHLTTII
jgi:hypothetical protein